MTKPERVTLATAVGKAAGRGVTPIEEALEKAATGDERKRRSPRGEGRRREEDRQGPAHLRVAGNAPGAQAHGSAQAHDDAGAVRRSDYTPSHRRHRQGLKSRSDDPGPRRRRREPTRTEHRAQHAQGNHHGPEPGATADVLAATPQRGGEGGHQGDSRGITVRAADRRIGGAGRRARPEAPAGGPPQLIEEQGEPAVQRVPDEPSATDPESESRRGQRSQLVRRDPNNELTRIGLPIRIADGTTTHDRRGARGAPRRNREGTGHLETGSHGFAKVPNQKRQPTDQGSTYEPGTADPELGSEGSELVELRLASRKLQPGRTGRTGGPRGGGTCHDRILTREAGCHRRAPVDRRGGSTVPARWPRREPPDPAALRGASRR